MYDRAILKKNYLKFSWVDVHVYVSISQKRRIYETENRKKLRWIQKKQIKKRKSILPKLDITSCLNLPHEHIMKDCHG